MHPVDQITGCIGKKRLEYALVYDVSLHRPKDNIHMCRDWLA